MKKGIVMDVNEDYITMLTPEGEFVKAKHTKSSYVIGEETTFFPFNERVSKASSTRFLHAKSRRFVIASSLVAILFLSLFIPLSFQNEVYAYMSIDINPSFEVGFDEELRVITLEALNSEAEKLLETMPDWKKASVDTVAEMIILKSKDSGYLVEGKEVVIATVVNDSHNINVDQELQKDIEEIKEEFEEEKIVVTTVTSTVETRNAAKKKGVSTGKLLIQENKLPKHKQEKNEEVTDTKQKSKVPVESNNNSKLERIETQEKVIEEFKNNGQERANDVRKELEQKKEEIRQKVNENIENSNMPDHVKEKIYQKFEVIKKKQGLQKEKKEERKKDREKDRDNDDNNRNNKKERNQDQEDD